MAAALLSYCIIFYIMITVKLTSQCLQTGNGNGLPDFVSSHGIYRIFQHRQAIIYTYRFNCCGKITAWGADIHPGDRDRDYTIDFQVWRPSPTVCTGTGCYSLVGNNRFTSISLSGGLARATPSPQDYIQFQPGDVLGFYMESDERGDEHGDPGIVLKNDLKSGNREVVWHASVDPNEAALLRKGCPCTWLAGANNKLPINFTRAAPIISIGTSAHPCPTTQPSIVSSSTANIGCPVQSANANANTSGHSLTPPVYFLFGFIAGIIMLLMIVIPAAGIMIFLKKSRAIQDTVSNQVYDSITRDQSHSSAIHTLNVMLPIKEASAENTSVDYECIGQGGDQKLESTVYTDCDISDTQVSKSSDREFEDVFDCVGTHIPTVEERGNYERDDQQEAAAYSQLNFFEEEQIYWAPASTIADLYTQLASKKYREISKEQIQLADNP